MVKKATEATPNRLLRAARKERNWTQKEVADHIGAPQSFNVSRWEQGTAFPSTHYIQQLCLLFEKSAKELGLSAEEPTQSNQPSAESEALPLWNVPFGRNPFFTGRGLLLERLHAQLSRSHSAALTQSYALSGLGGIGKTQTAIEYAYRYREEYHAVLWVRAASRETLVADFVALARLLALPDQNAQDQLLIVVAVKRWLEQQEGWLLILDNADELVLLADFLPSAGAGHVLLTTRAQATGKIAQSLSVEKMEVSEGVQLLLRRAKMLGREEALEYVSAAVRKTAQQLVEELDGLPLALDQAGAYIEDTGSSLSEYLQLYRRHHLALLQQQSSLSTDYPHTVASTWTLSFRQVEQANPAAADLLRLCAFLHPDAIPEIILTEGATELGPVLSQVDADPLLLKGAIQVLRRYSLVKRDPDTKQLNIHRLVQVVLKDSLDEAAQRQWAERSVRAVNRAIPEAEFLFWEQEQRYDLCLPHALIGIQLIEQYNFTFLEAARLLYTAGSYLSYRGQYAQVEPLLVRALALREQVLGPEHPETASALNFLAEFYVIRGNFQQAERLLQPALVGFERVLGPEHPVIATALEILATAYMYRGKYAEAEPLVQRSLAIREQVLGKSHFQVAQCLNDLAAVYYYQGKYALAEPLLQQALALYENMQGAEYQLTCITLNNLAGLYIRQGKYAQAEALFQRVLATRERVLGPEHPTTGISLRDLGRLYTAQGKYAQAEALLQRALALLERGLGLEHDFTIQARLSLAEVSQATGQEAQAESLYQQALASFESVLGPEHYLVAETLIGLAQLYTRKGHYKQAEQLLARALSIDEHALGPEHPQTATILDAQGHLALLQGREEQAEPRFQRALAIQKQALGSTHPDIAHTLQHMGALSQARGKYEQAEPLYQRALAIYEQALGPEHPDTITVGKDYHQLLQRMQEQGTGMCKQEVVPPGQ